MASTSRIDPPLATERLYKAIVLLWIVPRRFRLQERVRAAVELPFRPFVFQLHLQCAAGVQSAAGGRPW